MKKFMLAGLLVATAGSMSPMMNSVKQAGRDGLDAGRKALPAVVGASGSQCLNSFVERKLQVPQQRKATTGDKAVQHGLRLTNAVGAVVATTALLDKNWKLAGLGAGCSTLSMLGNVWYKKNVSKQPTA